MIVRRISPGSAFRITFFLACWVGLVLALFFTGTFALGVVLVPDLSAAAFPAMQRFAAPVGVLVIGVTGFLGAVFTALIDASGAWLAAQAYNGLAGLIGGFEIEVESSPASFDSADSGRNPPPPSAEA